MAQRTGDQRLIASPGKTTSAGCIPALVVAAALAVSGCGGDSDTEAASAPSSGSTAAEQTKTSAAAKSAASAGAEKSSESKSAGAQKPAGEGKHGTALTLPAEGKAPEPEPTPAELAHATVASISLQSSALARTQGSLAALPATYTCEGGNTSPPLSWQGVPAGTRELALFAMNVQPVGGRLFFDWAVGGLDPGLQSIESGSLPKGAVVGQNSFGKRGYSLCPAGESETYMFALYALPERLSPSSGFDPRQLRLRVLSLSGNVGLMPTFYQRG